MQLKAIETNKGAESHIAGLYTQEPRMIFLTVIELKGSLSKSLRRPLLRRPEVKKPRNDAVRMLGNDFSPWRQILRREELSSGVVATK